MMDEPPRHKKQPGVSRIVRRRRFVAGESFSEVVVERDKFRRLLEEYLQRLTARCREEFLLFNSGICYDANAAFRLQREDWERRAEDALRGIDQ